MTDRGVSSKRQSLPNRQDLKVSGRWSGFGRVLLLGLCAVVVGCGQDDVPGAPVATGDGARPPGRTVSDANFREPDVSAADAADMDASIDDGGMARDAPVDGGDAGGVDGDAADAPALTIQVTIVSPAPGGVVPALTKFTPQVDVVVQSPSGSSSDALKDVTAQVLERISKKVIATGKLNQVGFHTLPETSILVYNFAETPIDLAMAASGNYDLVVTAVTSGGMEGHASQPFQIDAGPAIRIASPVKDKAYKGSAPIDVSISDDYFAPVSDVQMKVGQTTITFAGPGGVAGDQYTATLDFASFMPALEGEQILTVRAKNKNGTESVLVRKFVSDSKGPTFSNAKPKDGDLVGNVITISVALTDPAGVLASSVVAVFANGPGTEYTIPLRAPLDGDTDPVYSAVFDTRLLPFGENALFPTLSFRASDSLGNESLLSNVVWLDNRPPLADLDPPKMRIYTKGESGVYACSWPFDPVGNDAADDGEIVPQIVNIRARIEDQGNDPLSGAPKYIPIAAVETAQLLVLDDITQPLVVNTNPVVAGNPKTDNECDAINPALIPTSKPMTASDALAITLTPISASGSPDMTNYALFDKVGDDRVIGGADESCPAGQNAKSPDPVCEVTRAGPKANYLYVPGVGWTPKQEVMTLSLGYAAGGAAGKLPSIWTLPKQDPGSTNLLCGGTQLDTLANFVSDGWACLAIFSTDKLGNKQVSRPFRLCIDKDADGKECPHKAVAQVTNTTPLVVETVADHNYVNGDEVRLSGISMVAVVNGTWNITVIDARHFSLNGSQSALNNAAPDWTRPTPVVGGDPFVPGYVVRTAEVPNCTGTVTAVTPTLVVDRTKSCAPWRTYRPGEMRVY
jgi:hypothetical protein